MLVAKLLKPLELCNDILAGYLTGVGQHRSEAVGPGFEVAEGRAAAAVT